VDQGVPSVQLKQAHVWRLPRHDASLCTPDLRLSPSLTPPSLAPSLPSLLPFLLRDGVAA